MQKANKKLTQLALALILSTTVIVSLWQAQYTVSPLEWGLMLSNAKDLAGGQIPYKQIFIQYGYLTTIIHAIAYILLGNNLQSLMTITSIAYAIGLFLIYRVAVRAQLTRLQSLSILLIYFLFHPVVIYPWSNYIAFPLLLLGLNFNLESKGRVTYSLISGLFFGLAILTREGLAPAIIIFILSCGFFQFIIKKDFREITKSTLIELFGMSIPIAMFIIYLVSNDLLGYWQKMAWDVPKVYTEVMFPHMRGFNIWRPWSMISVFYPLFDQIKHSFIVFEPRWMLFGLIVLVNIIILLKGVLSRYYVSTNLVSIKIAAFSLLLISSTLHLPEVFRVATGSAVGLINIWLLLRNYKYRLFFYWILCMMLVLTSVTTTSGYKFSTTNYFFPTKSQINTAISMSDLADFNGQKWPPTVHRYYLDIAQDLNLIKLKCPTVIYSHNDSHDAFLQIISPFLKYQLAPFWLFPEMVALRPEFDIRRKILIDQDLILLQSSNIAGVDQSLVTPEHFYLYRTYLTPNNPGKQTEIRLFVPLACDLRL